MQCMQSPNKKNPPFPEVLLRGFYKKYPVATFSYTYRLFTFNYYI